MTLPGWPVKNLAEKLIPYDLRETTDLVYLCLGEKVVAVLSAQAATIQEIERIMLLDLAERVMRGEVSA